MALYLGSDKIQNVAVKFEGSVGTDTSDATLTDGSQMLLPYTAYSQGNKITGTIPSSPGLTVTPTTDESSVNTTGYYMTGDIIVRGIQTETKQITANGTYTPTDGKFFSSVQVNVTENTPSYQSKTVDPSSSAQTIVADDGYDALEKVTINAIPNNYVGSAITRQGSNSLTVSDVTVTAPAGYYASAATKTVSVNHYYTGSSTPSSSLGSNGDIYLQIRG